MTKGPPPGPGPHVIESTKSGVHFGFADANEQNTVELTGRLHVDTGAYADYRPGAATLDRKGLADGINLRRARSNSVVPRSSSSACICSVTLDWARCSISPARVRLSVFATAMNVRRCFNCMDRDPATSIGEPPR